MSQKKLNHHDREVRKLVIIFKKGDTDNTIKASQLVLKKYPNSYVIHNIMGVSYASCNEFDKAQIHYKTSIKLNPTSAITYTNYGNLLRTIGKVDEAIDSYRKSIEINPNNYKTLNNLAITHQEIGGLNEAVEILKRAIKIDSINYLAHFNIANVYKDLELNSAAIKHYQLAKKANNEHSGIRNNLGLILNKEERYEEAIEDYTFNLKNNPEDVQSLVNIAMQYRQLGQLKKAIEFIDKARIYNKDKELEPRILSNKATIELDAGDFEDSIKDNKEALVLNPNYLPAYANNCLTLQQIGDYENLTLLYKKLLDQLEPAKEIASNNNILNKKLEEMSNIVALIKNSGRTGSIFLHSLLDGHPEVMTIPGVYFKGFFNPDLWSKLHYGNKNSNWRVQLLTNFFSFYDALFDAKSIINVPGAPMGGFPGYASGLSTLGEDKDISLKVDKEKFGQYMLTYLENFDDMTRSTFFKLIHLAYDSTIEKNTNTSVLFYHIHNPDFLESAQFIKDFPSAKFLQIVRDPIQALESWCKIDEKKEHVTASKEYSENNRYYNKFASVLNHFNNPIINYGKETTVIKLEDLKLETENTLRKLSKWLKIEYNQSMKNPSFQGHYYWGISKTTPGIKGFSKESISRELGIFFSENDQKRILPLMHFFRKNYSYTNTSEKDFIGLLNQSKDQLNELFDFEKLIISQSRSDDEKIDTQIKGLRVLMESIIKNTEEEKNLNNLPLTV